MYGQSIINVYYVLELILNHRLSYSLSRFASVVKNNTLILITQEIHGLRSLGIMLFSPPILIHTGC